jgi:hypothetical protein
MILGSSSLPTDDGDYQSSRQTPTPIKQWQRSAAIAVFQNKPITGSVVGSGRSFLEIHTHAKHQLTRWNELITGGTNTEYIGKARVDAIFRGEVLTDQIDVER